MAGWADADIVSALVSMELDAERCPGCGMTDEDARHVWAKIEKCATCSERDSRTRELRGRSEQGRIGLVVRWKQITSARGRATWSAFAKHTPEGAAERQRFEQNPHD